MLRIPSVANSRDEPPSPEIPR